jgi:hypothetical protein
VRVLVVAAEHRIQQLRNRREEEASREGREKEGGEEERVGRRGQGDAASGPPPHDGERRDTYVYRTSVTLTKSSNGSISCISLSPLFTSRLTFDSRFLRFDEKPRSFL